MTVKCDTNNTPEMSRVENIRVARIRCPNTDCRMEVSRMSNNCNYIFLLSAVKVMLHHQIMKA